MPDGREGWRCSKADGAFYASTPPVEGKKALFAMTARKFRGWRRGAAEQFWKLMLIDVKRAHLEATCNADDVHVALPEEDAKEGHYAKLTKWLYGMRGARARAPPSWS